MRTALTVMLSLSFVAGTFALRAEAAPLKCLERFKVNELVIGAWWGPDPTEANYQAYADAGFNVLMTYRNRANARNGEDYQNPDIEFELAEKLGLPIMLDTYMLNETPWGGVEPDPPVDHPNHHSARPAQLEWLLERYGESPVLAGILLGDNCGLHTYMAENARWLAEQRPDLWPWLSTNPNVDAQGKEPMPLLTTQNYPFLYEIGQPQETLRQHFCDRLDYDRAKANELGIALWPFNNCTDAVSPSQIRFQVYAMAAYGSQAIWYFHYNGGVWDPETETPGLLYPASQEANWHLRSVGDMIVGRRSPGAYHTAGPDMPRSAMIPGEGETIERMSKGLIAGVLVPEERWDAGDMTPDTIVIVDKRTVTPSEDEPGARRVHVKFGEGIESVTVHTAEETYTKELPPSRRLNLTLKAGGGAVIGLR